MMIVALDAWAVFQGSDTCAAAEAAVPEAPATAAASSQAKPQTSAEPPAQASSRPVKTKRARKPAIDLDSAIRDAAAASSAEKSAGGEDTSQE